VSAIVASLAIIAWVPAIAYETGIEGKFTTDRIQPDQALHKIIPYYWKSTKIYLTADEADKLHKLHSIEPLAGSIGAISIVVHGLAAIKNLPR
jgi:hypothetical protein